MKTLLISRRKNTIERESLNSSCEAIFLLRCIFPFSFQELVIDSLWNSLPQSHLSFTGGNKDWHFPVEYCLRPRLSQKENQGKSWTFWRPKLWNAPSHLNCVICRFCLLSYFLWGIFLEPRTAKGWNSPPSYRWDNLFFPSIFIWWFPKKEEICAVPILDVYKRSPTSSVIVKPEGCQTICWCYR